MKNLEQRFRELWWACDDHQLPDLPVYTRAEQLDRERSLDQFINAFAAEMETPPRTVEARRAAQERMLSAVDRFLRPALDLDRRHVDVLMTNRLTDRASEFSRMARRFDPSLRNEEVFQGSRNAWTMLCLQIFLGRPVQITPAVLGYSLIYPYSDNFLDDSSVSDAAKARFNDRLARRLAGERLEASEAPERPIWDLLSMIEDQYARSHYPQVYEGLAAIHRAQIDSVSLVRRGASPYEVDVLGVSLAKGGTSVMVDGILVAGTLTDPQAEALFGFGVLLQFGDDLQDVTQDRLDGLSTIFSQTAGHWPLDKLTTRLLCLREQVLRLLGCFDAPGSQALRELAGRATVHLVLQAAGRAPQFYSRSYMEELERRSPFRFSSLRRMRRKLARKGLSLSGVFSSLSAADVASTPAPAAAEQGSAGTA